MDKAMHIGLGAVALTGLVLIFDLIKIKKLKKQEENRSKCIKLCITGGPCGGKSQGIKCIHHTFKDIGAPFFIVPEAATIIGSSGLTLDLSNFEPRQIELYQIYLMRLQYNLQSVIMNVAKTMEEREKAPVILCDRGLLDGKAYAGDKNWAEMLRHIKITEADIINRYKGVIHMETAARGAQNNYLYSKKNVEINNSSDEIVENKEEKQGDNKVRVQTPEMAIDLDRKLQECYRNHPFRFVIQNNFFVNNFETKKLLLVAQVNQILEFFLKSNNIADYYREYEASRRKMSDEYDSDNNQIVPYLERKRKFQKFIKDRQRSPQRS